MVSWRKSAAKAKLYDDLIKGVIPVQSGPGDPGPKELYETRYQHDPAFQDDNSGDAGKFSSRLRALRKQIATKYDRSKVDSDALANDRLIFPEQVHNDAGRGYPKWGGSGAKALLKVDVDAGLHLMMKPSELRMTRQEYQAYPPPVFRDHIYQELKSRKKNAKKKKLTMRMQTRAP